MKISLLDVVFILIGVFFTILFVLAFISMSLQKDACDNFGGKITNSFKCVKGGAAYNIENINPFGWDFKVVKVAVEERD